MGGDGRAGDENNLGQGVASGFGTVPKVATQAQFPLPYPPKDLPNPLGRRNFRSWQAHIPL